MSVIVLAGVGFSIAALTFAFLAACLFARSAVVAPRYRRTPQRPDGAGASPEGAPALFPNLFGK